MNKTTPRTRLTPPVCMGRRMSKCIDGWCAILPEIGFRIQVRGTGWWINPLADTKTWYCLATANGVASGEQAAANAAQRWLVKRAELTLKLAGRRVTP